MITKLISVSDFVKIIQSEVKEKQSKLNSNDRKGFLLWNDWGFERICKYNDFVLLEPKLCMFAVCDENGVSLEKPFDYDKWKDYDEQGLELYFSNEEECQQYKNAEDKVLFKNCTVNEYGYIITEGWGTIAYYNSFYKTINFSWNENCYDCFYKEKIKHIDEYDLEGRNVYTSKLHLISYYYNLELTQSALNKIF